MQASDLSPKAIIGVLPKFVLQPQLGRSFFYLFADVACILLFAAIVVFVDHWLIALPFSFLLGTALTGLFVVGHDCGHRSFAKQTWINDGVGEFATGMALWPFHVWRLSHDIHHRHTQNIEKDIAWVPFTVAKLERLHPIPRTVYLYTRTTLFFIASHFFTYYNIKDAMRGGDSTHFEAQDWPKIRRSLLITLFLNAAVIGASVGLAGWYGLLWLYVFPQLVFQFWLSTFTLFHHTHEENPFIADEEWTFAKGQLDSTVHVGFPKWVEVMTHHINWHVPHHVCVGIPHYHLKTAHRALRQHFPERVREEEFGADLIWRTISVCHHVTGKQLGELSWQQADALFVPKRGGMPKRPIKARV